MKLSGEKKDIVTFGSGAAVGITQVILLKAYVDQYGPIPFIGGYIPWPWNLPSTLGNILIGGVVLGVSQFTKVVKNSDLKHFLATYGITALVGGILNGIFPGTAPGARARAGARRLVARAPVVSQAARTAAVMPLTQTGIPPARILA